MERVSTTKPSRWLSLAGLTVVVLFGAYLRLANLDARSVTDVEMYVPGIHMPQGISIPGERMRLAKVVTGTFSSDTHPPAYYVLMWGWTKIFGTSVRAIRTPAALLGIGCIPLVWWLGVLTGQRIAGWFAAILLAANPHDIFWSQTARMFSLACFLGLLATVLLFLLVSKPKSPRWLAPLYVAVVIVGLTSHVFFWALFGTHVLWTLISAWGQKQCFSGVTSFQILALILGSPLLAFAAYQNGNVLATLSRNSLVYAREYIQFSFLFPQVGFSSGVYPADLPSSVPDDPHVSIARWLFVLLSLTLCVIGIVSIREPQSKVVTSVRGPSAKSWLAAAGAATLATLLFVVSAKVFVKPEPNPTLRTTEFMALLPLSLFFLALVLEKYWNQLLRWLPSIPGGAFLGSGESLVLALALVPFLVLSSLAQLKPTLNARGMTLLGPYLLLVLSWGIGRASRNRAAAVALFVVLVAAHYEGLRAYKRMSAGRADYKALAALVGPEIAKSDLVFVRPSWYGTPIFYYLNSDWDHFVGHEYESACSRSPAARVWVLMFDNYDHDVPKDMRGALQKYQVIRTVRAPDARAVLYSPNSNEWLQTASRN